MSVDERAGAGPENGLRRKIRGDQAEQMNKLGMEVVEVELRDAFGGGLHFFTADLYRAGGRVDYYANCHDLPGCVIPRWQAQPLIRLFRLRPARCRTSRRRHSPRRPTGVARCGWRVRPAPTTNA